jgi:uncharacterized protein involved in outer membrane biogenesis
MSEATAVAKPGSRSWLRKILIAGAGLLAVLLVLYFVATSSAFFKGVILPRAGKALNADISVADASIRPFSQVVLRKLSLKTTGPEPFATAEEVRLRYSLLAILRGHIRVDEVTLISPVFQITRQADGSSNLDPLLHSGSQPTSAGPAKAGPPPRLDLHNVKLKNGTFRFASMLKDGTRETAETREVNLSLDRLTPGEVGTLNASAVLQLDRPGAAPASLQSKAEGKVQIRLAPDLLPESLQATVTHDVRQATGDLAALAGQRTTMEAELTATEIRKFTVGFSRGTTSLGALQVSGPFDIHKLEGRLKFELKSIDRQALNLAGAPFGLDFETTQLNGSAELQLSAGGDQVGILGSLSATRFSVTRDRSTTPAIDLSLGFDVAVDAKGQSVRVNALKLDGTSGGRPLLRGALTQPMSLAWGATPGSGDSVFDLELTGLRLTDWRAFTGDLVPAGDVGARARLAVLGGGKRLDVNATGRVDGLSLRLDTNRVDDLALNLVLNSSVTNFDKVSLQQAELELRHRGVAAAVASARGTLDPETGGTFEVGLRADIPAVAGLVPQPGVRLDSGKAELTARVIQTNALGHGPAAATYAAAGRLQVTNLTGTLAGTALTRIGFDVDYDMTQQGAVTSLRQGKLKLPATRRAANELLVTGRIDLTPTNPSPSALTLRAESLDLTQLADSVSSAPGAAPAKSPAPVQSSTAAPAPGEPEPITLPIQRLTLDAKVDRLYLREVAVSNWVARAEVQGSRVSLKPFELTMNGAPVMAATDLDLGVKGWRYDMGFNVGRLPLEPIANSLRPDERGQYRGTLELSGQVRGGGLTGASLRKTLGGQLAFGFTNANLQLMKPKTKSLVVPIATLLRINEITNSPVNWILARGAITNGTLALQQFTVQSDAFEAHSQGTIPIDAVLTNSPLNFPVDFWLRRRLADKAGLTPANTPTNVPYVQLPQFVTVRGTLGQPKSDV